MTSTPPIAKNIAGLRREKGVTQEVFAQAMGVTNQAVSKWESGAACPDIGLLVPMAAYFDTTVDVLLGHTPEGGTREAERRIHDAFVAAPAEEAFALAFRLCRALHEGAVSYGFRRPQPWQRNADPPEDWAEHWGYSAVSEPEGASIMRRGAAFFSSARDMPGVPSRMEMRGLHGLLQPLAREETLRTLFALHSLTASANDALASLDAVAERAGLPLEEAERALDALPVETGAAADGDAGYRLAGFYSVLPPLLTLLIPPR